MKSEIISVHCNVTSPDQVDPLLTCSWIRILSIYQRFVEISDQVN
jgi:hypothetical protein